jgi:N-acetylmuramoyl-L-alanine amidase
MTMKQHLLRALVAPLAIVLLPGFITLKDLGADLSSVKFDEKKYAIRERPISFTAKRKKLTLDYIRKNYNRLTDETAIVPKLIVVHWTSCGTFEDTFNYFNRETLQPDRGDIRRGGEVNVSAHYVVDRDGTIYRLMPDTMMARHVIGLNHCSIGIENVGGPAYPLTDAQVEANAWLVLSLARQYPSIERVIGHHEYLGLKDGPLWRSLDPKYVARPRKDPGDAFMQKVRDRLKKYTGE